MHFVVVFKAYAWDPFVTRQAFRCSSAAGSGDFFVSLDESTRSLEEIPFPNVFRADGSALAELGLQQRYEEGSLLWWNPDYTHYAFKKAHPEYDFYVFVEYDADIKGSYEDVVVRAADAGADVVALPIKVPPARWRWTLPHRQTYTEGELVGALVCVSIFSSRALDTLIRCRLDMTEGDDLVPFWPSAEVFVPTEARRAGLVTLSLAQFGDVSRYDAFPPMLESDKEAAADVGDVAFFHPVLDADRYVASLLRSSRFIDFVMVRSQLYRLLARAARRPSSVKIMRAAVMRLANAARVRRQHITIRVFGTLAGRPWRELRTSKNAWHPCPSPPGEDLTS